LIRINVGSFWPQLILTDGRGAGPRRRAQGGFMRILFIHPNYYSGGAEIAGNWPPAWVAYLSGSPNARGSTEIAFIDAMTRDIGRPMAEAGFARRFYDLGKVTTGDRSRARR
jgi:hypothetical protein